MRLALLLVLLLAGCVQYGYREPRQVHAVQQALERQLEAEQAAGRWAAAARLARSLDVLRPEGEARAALAGQAPAELAGLFDEPTRLGVNRALRAPTGSSTWKRVALWLPDRLLDLLDVVSFDVGLGPGLYANVHATRGFQLGGGVRANAGVGWHEGRALGSQVIHEQGWVLPGAGSMTTLGLQLGGGQLAGSQRLAGFQRPSDRLYRDLRDYWAVGAAVQLAVVGAEVDLHPVELADFVTGIFGFDLLGDDLATGEAEPLDWATYMLVTRLNERVLDDRSMEAYRSWLEADRSGPGEAPGARPRAEQADEEGP